MRPPVMAISDAKNNGELMEEVERLGYIKGHVLDVTYGKGRFWSVVQPRNLVTSDLDTSTDAGENWDFTDLPVADESYDTVVFDPPYKLSGTPVSLGPASGDASYGITKYVPMHQRHQLIYEGIDECLRVLRSDGYLLMKCQDQVSSGHVVWQTRLFADYAEQGGLLGDYPCRLVDMLHLVGYRRQPMGTRQLHARRNYSTLLVLEKK